MDADEFQRRLGRHMRARRRQLGLTQQDVAQHLGLTRSSVSNIEAGNQPLSLLAFLRLADYLDSQPGELLDAARDGARLNRCEDLPLVPSKYRSLVDSIAGGAVRRAGVDESRTAGRV